MKKKLSNRITADDLTTPRVRRRIFNGVVVGHLLFIFLPMAALIVSGWFKKPLEQFVSVNLVSPDYHEPDAGGPVGDGTPAVAAPEDPVREEPVEETPVEQPAVEEPDDDPVPPSEAEPLIDFKKLEADRIQKEKIKQQAAEAAKRKAEEEAAKRKAEAAKRKAEEEAAKRKAEAAKRKAEEEAAKRKAAAEAARRKAEAEAEAARQKAEADRIRKDTLASLQNSSKNNNSGNGPVNPSNSNGLGSQGTVDPNYNGQLKNFIYGRWNPPEENQLGGRKPEVKIYLEVNADGKVRAAKILKGSGVPAMDESVRVLLKDLLTNGVPAPKTGEFRVEYTLKINQD